MKDIILRGKIRGVLAKKYKGENGFYKPMVINLDRRGYFSLSPETQAGLMPTRYADNKGRVFIVVESDLYNCRAITARSRIREYGFDTPDEAIYFALRNVSLLALLILN